jgi:hypothetical protein
MAGILHDIAMLIHNANQCKSYLSFDISKPNSFFGWVKQDGFRSSQKAKYLLALRTMAHGF